MKIKDFDLLEEYNEIEKRSMKATSFSGIIRNKHVDRLPVYKLKSINVIKCPYCGKFKERRALAVDHIIPIGIFLRYELYMLALEISVSRDDDDRSEGSDRSSLYAIKKKDDPYKPSRREDRDRARKNFEREVREEKEIERIIRRNYSRLASDESNLILCCAKCNKTKTNRPPDECITEFYLSRNKRRFKGRSPYQCMGRNLLKEKQNFAVESKKVMSDIRLHDLNDFFLNGTVPRGDVRARIVNKLIISFGREDMDLSNLVPRMITNATCRMKEEENRKLRLCLYCLGLFNKLTFTIDHINPVRRGNNIGNFMYVSDKDEYNRANNLVAVCHSCNSAKGDRKLTENFIRDRVRARQQDELPGIEHAENGIGSNAAIKIVVQKLVA